MLYFKQYASAKAFELIIFSGIQMSAPETSAVFLSGDWAKDGKAAEPGNSRLTKTLFEVSVGCCGDPTG